MEQGCRIELLGGLCVRRRDEVTARFATQKVASLLAFLAYHLGQLHPRETLMELLWPDADPAAARNRLSNALSSLRAALEPPGVAYGSALVATRLAVGLQPDAVRTDIQDFAQVGDTADESTLVQAVGLWAGPLLPGFYEGWIAVERDRLAALQTDRLLQLSRRARERGDLSAAENWARQAISVDPLFEPAVRQLLELLGVAGRTIEAVRVYRALEAQVRATLSDEPSEETKALLASIQAGAEGSAPSHLEALPPSPRLVPAERPDPSAVWTFLAVGEEVTTFTLPREAADRALALQREGETPAQAIGLHTASDRGDGRAQVRRLLAAAHPRQILCTEATAVLLSRPTIATLRLTDLGIYQLDGAAGPERLFQLEAADAPRHIFPPPCARPGFRSALPRPLTRFFGREEESAALIGLLSPEGDERLVTLIGPGGSGKTRLALAAAQALQARYPGATWFVSLVDVAGAEGIVDAALEATGEPRVPQRAALDQLVDLLARGPGLLVLDNAEPLIEETARFVRFLLQRVPELRCLVTSRIRLDIGGERELPVLPLPLPDEDGDSEGEERAPSLLLFVDRARAVRPDFHLSVRNAPAVRRLCRRLEGLPLAIELAASRAQVMTPAQMLEQLDHRLDFLATRRRDVAERHRSLRSTIAWSYGSLPAPVQRFFCRLSVFRGGWTEAAAVVVCDDPLALDHLAQLVDSSLVTVQEIGATARFGMLETLREFAAELLEPEDREAAERRHGDFFLHLAESAAPRLTGPDQLAWLERLDAEQENLRLAMTRGTLEAGLRLGGALWRYWSIRGTAAVGRSALADALARAEGAGASPKVRARALLGLGALAHDQNDTDAAAQALEESVALLLRCGTDADLATALNCRANVHYDLGELAQAEAAYTEALARNREIGEARGIAMVLTNLGALCEDTGDLERAVALLDEALSIKRGLGDRYGLAMTLDNLGNVEMARERFEAAAGRFEESLALRQELGHRQGVAMSLLNLGIARLAMADVARAAAAIEEAIGRFRSLEDWRSLCEALGALAGVRCAAGRSEEAAHLLGFVAVARRRHGIVAGPQEVEREARFADQARQALGAGTFAANSARGELLDLAALLDNAIPGE